MGCECNWSTFEHASKCQISFLCIVSYFHLVISKLTFLFDLWYKYDRFILREPQKLQDLVLIKYNQTLKEWFNNWDVIEPILLNDIDDSNKWLLGEMSVDKEDVEDELDFGDDGLTLGDISTAVRAKEPPRCTRITRRLKKKTVK